MDIPFIFVIIIFLIITNRIILCMHQPIITLETIHAYNMQVISSNLSTHKLILKMKPLYLVTSFGATIGLQGYSIWPIYFGSSIF